MPELNQAREVMLRLTACHPEKAALDLLAREVAPAGTSWAAGTTGSGGGRSSASPSIRQYAFLLNKDSLTPAVALDGQDVPTKGHAAISSAVSEEAPATPVPAASPIDAPKGWIEVPLIRLAWARSGDKGNTSNIGIIARRPEWLPLLRAELTESRVAEYLQHLVKGTVTRHELPGIHAFNFVCEQALGGGGMASLRNDPLGKGMGQILLSAPIRVPAHWFS